ncbi:MAG: hypothetical protein NTZ48_05095 [Candidatus Omnitrophica bacterium]|nr:hypothetical protein [Candidatus Omnitrophota bacterium]
MKNKNVVIFVLIAILFSPHPAQARRVREVESYSAEDIANIIVRSEPFYRHEPMFLSGIPNEMSKDVADAIDKIVRGSEAVFISFSDLV